MTHWFDGGKKYCQRVKGISWMPAFAGMTNCCHPGLDPGSIKVGAYRKVSLPWMPAFAGMTREVPQ